MAKTFGLFKGLKPAQSDNIPMSSKVSAKAHRQSYGPASESVSICIFAQTALRHKSMELVKVTFQAYLCAMAAAKAAHLAESEPAANAVLTW